MEGKTCEKEKNERNETLTMASINKKLEKELLEAANNLLDPPSSVNNLLLLLCQVGSCLLRVEQSPAESMENALSSISKALIADKLIKDSDVDVKVALAYCFSELARITAPDAPYCDHHMKEVFRLIVSSFEILHDKLSRWYAKKILILELVAKVGLCVLMLDLECDDLILKMFQHFLEIIREHHPKTVFSSMETIMILCLEESEDISLDLLSPILESVKKDNEKVLPIARRLGERVIESCATKLKPYLVQAVNTLGISLDDYSDVLASVCNDISDNLAENDVHDCKSGEEPVEESAQVDSEITKEATPPQQDNDADGDRSPKSVMSYGIAQAGEDDTLVESKPPKKLDGTDSPVLSKGKNVSDNEERNDLDTEIIDSKEQKLECSTKRKGKKTSSSKSTKPSKRSNIVSEKEAEKTFDSKSPNKEVPSSLNEDGFIEATGTLENDKEIKATISSPNVGDIESDAVVSHSPSESNHDENRSKKRVRSKKKDSSVKEVTAEHISKKVSEGTCDSKIKLARPSAKKVLGRSSDVKVSTIVDAVKKGRGKTEKRTKGDGVSSLRNTEDKKNGSGKTEERTKVDAVKKGSGKTVERTKGDGVSSLRKPDDKKKGIGKTEERTKVDAVKRGSGKTAERTKGDGVSSLRKPEDKKKGSGKTEERTKVDDGSSSRKSEDKKKRGQMKGSSEKGLAKSSSKDEDKVTVSSLKSAAKTTKDEYSEETPKTNLKRKRTPGKEKVPDIKKND